MRASGGVRGARAPGACRVRASAHRLRGGAPLSGLEPPCFLRAMSRGLRGTSRPPEHVGAAALMACAPGRPNALMHKHRQGRRKKIAGGRWRGRDKPPARATHGHLAARITELLPRAVRAPRGPDAALTPTPFVVSPDRGPGLPFQPAQGELLVPHGSVRQVDGLRDVRHGLEIRGVLAPGACRVRAHAHRLLFFGAPVGALA